MLRKELFRIASIITVLTLALGLAHPASTAPEHQTAPDLDQASLVLTHPLIKILASLPETSEPQGINPQGVTSLRCEPVQPPPPFEVPPTAPVVHCEVEYDNFTQEPYLRLELPSNQNSPNTIYAIAIAGTNILMLDGHLSGFAAKGCWINPNQRLLTDRQAVECQDGSINPVKVVIDNHRVTIRPTGDQTFLHYRVGPNPGNRETLIEYIVFDDGSEVSLHDLILKMQASNGVIKWWDRKFQLTTIPSDRLATFPIVPKLPKVEARGGIIPLSPESIEPSLAPEENPPTNEIDPTLAQEASPPISTINIHITNPTKKYHLHRQNPDDLFSRDPNNPNTDLDVLYYLLKVDKPPFNADEQLEQMSYLIADDPPIFLYDWLTNKGDRSDMIKVKESLPADFVIDSFVRHNSDITINARDSRGIFSVTLSKSDFSKILLTPGNQITPESLAGSPNPVMQAILFELLTGKEPFLSAHVVAPTLTSTIWQKGRAYASNTALITPTTPAYLTSPNFDQAFQYNIPTGIPITITGVFREGDQYFAMATFTLPDGIASPELNDQLATLRETAINQKLIPDDHIVYLMIPIESLVPDYHSSKTPLSWVAKREMTQQPSSQKCVSQQQAIPAIISSCNL